MPLLTLFQLLRGGQVYLWRKPEKTMNLLQVADKPNKTKNYIYKQTHNINKTRATYKQLEV
jgi:hypothetical protein